MNNMSSHTLVGVLLVAYFFLLVPCWFLNQVIIDMAKHNYDHITLYQRIALGSTVISGILMIIIAIFV